MIFVQKTQISKPTLHKHFVSSISPTHLLITLLTKEKFWKIIVFAVICLSLNFCVETIYGTIKFYTLFISNFRGKKLLLPGLETQKVWLQMYQYQQYLSSSGKRPALLFSIYGFLHVQKNFQQNSQQIPWCFAPWKTRKKHLKAVIRVGKCQENIRNCFETQFFRCLQKRCIFSTKITFEKSYYTRRIVRQIWKHKNC